MELTEALSSITYFNPNFSHINAIKIHPKYERVYWLLNWSEINAPNYDNEMILLITNVLNKFGFVLMARDNIINHDGNRDPNLQVVIQYELNNFITYTKSTLDSIAIVINEMYQIGRSNGGIDLKWGSFYNELCKINPKSLVASRMKTKRVWIKEVVNWRDQINHRTFNVIGQLTQRQVLDDYAYRIAREPINMLIFGNYQYLSQKYGDGFTQTVSTFCERWVNDCKDFVDTLGDELVYYIQLFKK
jgi:hypothetical protein